MIRIEYKKFDKKNVSHFDKLICQGKKILIFIIMT